MSKQNNYANFIAICSLVLSTTAMAGQVGSMNTFTAGTAAVAADVNANFSEHTAQINDNHARITAMRTGAVSVAAQAFRNESDAQVCDWTSLQGSGYGYFETSSSATGSCDVVTGIALPDGVTLTGMSCTLLDNTPATSMDGRLYRTNLTTGASEVVYDTASTIDDAGIQVLSVNLANNPGAELVNNALYVYSLTVNYSAGDFTGIGDAGRVYGCSVTY